MTQDRWSSSDPELTNALRELYAAPADEHYWNDLEARIIAYVAAGNSSEESESWWSYLADMARPGLVAAAALILAASALLVHSRQLEVSNAYASVINPAPPSVEAATTRAAAIGDGDFAIHYLISH
jgi:hypothetical protein